MLRLPGAPGPEPGPADPLLLLLLLAPFAFAEKLRLRGSWEAEPPDEEDREGAGVRRVSYPAEVPGGGPWSS